MRGGLVAQRKLDCVSPPKEGSKTNRSHYKQEFRMKKVIHAHVPTDTFIWQLSSNSWKNELSILTNYLAVPFSLAKS